MASRVVHFEIHAEDPEAVSAFFGELFGWQFSKWEGPMDYWLISTGAEDTPGIHGGLVRRMGPSPSPGQAVNAYVCTVNVDDLDASLHKAASLGGVVCVPKMAIPGVGYLAYINDPAGNIMGMMQNDPTAA